MGRFKPLWFLLACFLPLALAGEPARAQDLMGIATCDPDVCSHNDVSAVETADIGAGFTRGSLIESLRAKGLIQPERWLTPESEL